MSNWIGDFHPALLLRALGLVVIFSALYVYRLLAHPPWSLGASLRQRILHGSPPWRHHGL